MHRFLFAAVLLLGSAILVGVNAIEHNRTCSDGANLISRGICYMRTGFEADRNGQMEAAVEDIRLAREVDPGNGTYALYECQWLAKAGQHEAALATCEETLVLSASDPSVNIAAQVQMSVSAQALGNADLLQRSCAALRLSGAKLGPACS